MPEFTPFAPVTVEIEIALSYATIIFLVVSIVVKMFITAFNIMKGETE